MDNDERGSLEGVGGSEEDGAGGKGSGGELGLEARLARIDEIVAALDSDSVEVSRALALFEEGMEHVERAEEALALVEVRVKELAGPHGEDVRDLRLEDGDEPDDG